MILKLELSYAGDFDSYLSTHQAAIRLLKGDKYDILTDKNSKFLIYQLNDYINRNKRLMERVRYAIILEEKVDLLELKRQNW